MYVCHSGSFFLHQSLLLKTNYFLMFLFGLNFSPGIIPDLLSFCTTCNYLKFRTRFRNNARRFFFFDIPNIRSAHARPVDGDVRRVVSVSTPSFYNKCASDDQ